MESAAAPPEGKAWRQYADPAAAGWSTEKLAEARAYAETLKSTGVMAVHRGNVLVAWGDVVRRVELHSVRKSLVSALAGIHAAAGRIDLNATLAALGIDDIPALTPIERSAKIDDLLKARSGIYHAAAKEPADMKKNRPSRGSHEPGTFWFYNNWDFNTVGVVTEKSAGKSLFDDFDERIARPLGMEDYRSADGYGQFERRLSMFPAHAFRMSVRDLARFGWMFAQGGRWNGRDIVPPDWVRSSTQGYSESRPGTFYGRMWWVYPKGGLGDSYPALNRFDKFAALGTGGQLILVVPEADFVFVHLADTDYGQSVGGSACWRLAEMILSARLGDPEGPPLLVDLAPIPYASVLPPVMEWAAVIVPAAVLAKYAGAYELEGGGKVEISLYGDRLAAFLAGQGEADLFASSPTRFFMKAALAEIEFLPDERGEVFRLKINFQGRVREGKKIAG